MMHSRFVIAVLAAAACLAVNPVFAQDESALIQRRHEIREMAQDALASLYEASPRTRSVIEHAAGYGVFSTFGIKLFFAGGTTGKGIVVNNRTSRQTFMKMLQVQAGLGFGASRNRVIFVFQTERALRTFVDQGWEFSGQANLAAAASAQGGSLAGAVSVSPGVYIYQLTDTGLAATVTLAGTKFFKDDELN